MSLRFLSDLEAGRGNISVVRLEAVGAALELPIDRLIRDDGDDHPARHATRERLIAALDDLSEDEIAEMHVVLRMRRTAAAAFDKYALIGLRGAGKTTVGTRVARRLRVPFIELDQRIEAAAGMSLENVFSIHGEPYSRRLERDVLADVVERRGPVVIAAGGGIVTHPETYALLTRACFTLWLEASPADHWSRVVAQGDQRPMRGKPKAMAELSAILAARRPLYARAHRRIDTSQLGLDGTVETVLAAIAKR